jgi:DNA-binding NarL/FixJ family response regulator
MKRILVIEDQEPLRQSLLMVLRLEEFHVIVAENGRRGLELALSSPPDLILCDVMMPEVNGHTVLQQLRQNPATSKTPFIFMSAKGEKKDLRAGMNLGADDYLIKPVSRDELLAAIEARFERHRSQTHQHETQLDFSSAIPLESLGLTPREAEVLLWVAQGKTNSDIASIFGLSEGTVKKHLVHIFEKLGLESRSSAALRAIEVLSRQPV